MLRRLALAALLALAPHLAAAQFATIGPTPPVTDNGDRLATTAWVNNFFALGIPLASGKIFVGSAGGLATAQSMSGDCTLGATGIITCTQAAGNFQVIGNLTVGGSIIDGSGILATNIAAPATPAAGTTRIYVDSTQKVLTFKNDAGTVGNAVVPSTCGANLFGTSISAAGVFGCTQPAVSNISGFGTGVATALGANVTGSGGIALANGPTFTGSFTATGLVPYASLASAAIATGAQYLAGTASELVQSGVIYQGETTTTFGSTTTFDFSTFINTNVTLTANITTQTLTNVTAGKAGTISFTQSGAGSFTTVWNSIFKFAGGTTPSLTTGSTTAVDVLSYSCRSATFCVASLLKDVK